MAYIRSLIQRLTGLYSNYKVVIQNFSYLSALQAFNIILPLITYPYLIRVLGAKQYGVVIFAHVIATYFSILIDFGYKISATRNIAINKNKKDQLSVIVSSVLSIKFILWLLSFGILFVLVNIAPGFKEDKLLFLLSFGITFNEFIFPQWYFQGVERMKYITFFNLSARIIFLVLIFVVINQREDYIYVPLLNTIGALVGGSLGLYQMFVVDKIKFRIPQFTSIKYYFKESLPIFGSTAIISIKDRFNVIFIAYSLGMEEVTIYDLANKIMRLFMQPIDIINSTFYPRISISKNMRVTLRIGLYSSIAFLFVILALQPFLPMIIDFLGKGGLQEALFPTRILLIAPLTMCWSLAIGRNCLLVHGKYKIFTLGMILTTVFYLILIGLAYTFQLHTYIMTFILITVFTYAFELIFRALAAKKLLLNAYEK